jgi:hypothetical protein
MPISETNRKVNTKLTDAFPRGKQFHRLPVFCRVNELVPLLGGEADDTIVCLPSRLQGGLKISPAVLGHFHRRHTMQIADNRLTVTSWYFTGTRHFELDIPRQMLKQWHGLFIEACSVARSD